MKLKKDNILKTLLVLLILSICIISIIFLIKHNDNKSKSVDTKSTSDIATLSSVRPENLQIANNNLTNSKFILVTPSSTPTIKPTNTPTPTNVPTSTPVVISVNSDVKGIYFGRFRLTAYCPCNYCNGQWAHKDKNGNWYCDTAAGTVATEGRTIACNVLPLGTKVLIDGHEYIVEDRFGGNDYSTLKIDVYHSTHQRALNFNMGYYDVFIVD